LELKNFSGYLISLLVNFVLDTSKLGGRCLVEEANDFTSNMLTSGLLVVHDSSTGGEDNVTELTRWKQLDNPLLKILEGNVVAGRDDTGLVETAIELDHNLAVAVIINFFEFANVAVLLHDAQELDDDLGAGSDEDLTLAGLLGIVDALKSVVEDGCLDHVGGSVMRFSSRVKRGLEVSARRVFC